KPPKISNKEIYKYNTFNPFNFTKRIQTIEQTIKITKTQQNIQLLDEKTIKELAKNFKYIHFALVQVTIKPLTRQGLNTSILANFDDSLIGAIETSLCNGPVYFDGYPNLTISLTDKNILETLKINIKLHGYNMLPGSEIIAIIHHVNYKDTNSICPKSLVNLLKDETTMMKYVTNDSNILIPQKIKWSDINILEDWSIQSDTIAPNQENIENTSLHSITQNEEGLVKIRFDKTIKTHSTPEDLKEKFNYLNICDEKLDKNYQLQPHRASTSIIRSGKINYFDTKTKLSEISSHSSILKGIYTRDDFQNSQNDSQEINEPISPTYSDMKPHSQLMTIIIDESFEINKDLIRKDFLQEKYLRKRHKFFKKYSDIEQSDIRIAWYEYMVKIKAHVMFFNHLPIYNNQQENKKYFEEEKIIKNSPEKIIDGNTNIKIHNYKKHFEQENFLENNNINLEKENKHFSTEEITSIQEIYENNDNKLEQVALEIQNNENRTISMINTDKQKESSLLIQLTDKIDDLE
ncbi:MP domain-containing protein, partial [Cephalotus follicularis]